jgi:serine protease Do
MPVSPSVLKRSILVLVLLGSPFNAVADERSAPGAPSEPTAPAYCRGEYAEDFAALSAPAQALEREHSPYTFCLRTVATYACPFYGPDGELQRKRKRVVAHGTGFAYQHQGKETLLLTNQHVAEWPAVTDQQHPVDDVPAGCKRISESISVVDDESDAFEKDDLELSRVVSDPQLDMAVLRSHSTLPILPWKLGHSAGISTRNVVHVRGFPLGIFKATNVGKVISAYDHDSYGEWDHDDFVVDALLSSGNSGSPVLAISCKTGEFELVGVYHAGYSRGSALNVVVGIDQVRELMTTLQRTQRPATDHPVPFDFDPSAVAAEIRHQAIGALRFPFGALIAGVRMRPDGAFLFEVLARSFPFDAYPLLVAESLPGADPAAPFARVWFGSARGLAAYAVSELDAETQAQTARIGRGLRLDSSLAARYRSAARDVASRQAAEEVAHLEQALKNAASSQRELARIVSDLAERLGPRVGAPGASLADVLEVPGSGTPGDGVVGEGSSAPPRSSASVSQGESVSGAALER